MNVKDIELFEKVENELNNKETLFYIYYILNFYEDFRSLENENKVKIVDICYFYWLEIESVQIEEVCEIIGLHIAEVINNKFTEENFLEKL